MVLKIVRTVWPVMLTYVAIGAPCGMIMGQTGMEPWMVFALSSTFVTGSGQFMICNLWLAGVPAASIVASVAAISSRFALYSASIAPHLRGASKRQTLAVAATLTEEAYGISLAKLVEGEDWGPRESFVLNVILIATWGVSCTTGAIVGAVVDVPTAIAAFVCTSLFICLLFSQRLSRGNVVAAVSGAVSVAVCKFLGLTNIAVPASVVVGIAIALACDAVFDGRGARDARYRGPGLYPARCLCRAGRQRLGEPRRVRRGTLACLGPLDCGRRRRGRGGQDKIDAVVLRLGHRTLYRLEPYIGVASRAPNLVPSQLVEFFTELVYFFWYHGQTLL